MAMTVINSVMTSVAKSRLKTPMFVRHSSNAWTKTYVWAEIAPFVLIEVVVVVFVVVVGVGVLVLVCWWQCWWC